METTKIYAIYDAKADAYMQPFFATTHGLAIRNFADTTQNEKSIFNKHPEDFTLFHIGSFDETNGTLTPETKQVPLGKAIEHLTSE